MAGRTFCRVGADYEVESRPANLGGGYRLWREYDTHREGEPEAGQEARTASRPPAPRAQDHETAPSPQAAPAPEGSPEQPADEAAEVPSVPSPPAADTILGLPVVEDLELHVAPDLELYVLQLLADLDPEARERVLQFAVAKWWLT